MTASAGGARVRAARRLRQGRGGGDGGLDDGKRAPSVVSAKPPSQPNRRQRRPTHWADLHNALRPDPVLTARLGRKMGFRGLDLRLG